MTYNIKHRFTGESIEVSGRTKDEKKTSSSRLLWRYNGQNDGVAKPRNLSVIVTPLCKKA